MGPAIAKFLQAAISLAKKGVKETDILKAAKQEFGEVSDLLKIQIRRLYKNKDAPSIKNPEKKTGEVVPFKKDQASGIMSTEEASPLMKRLDDVVDMLQKNPKRPGGGLDPAVGLTRTLTRRILDKKGIEIGKKDPIDVFSDTFGESINDVNNLAEEMLEIDRRGGGMKDMDQMLEIEGLFDIEIPKNPQRGITDDEMLEIQKAVDEENILLDFDPTDRKPNSEGGINTLMASDDMNERLLEKLYEDFLDQGLSPEDAKKAAEEAFRERAADGGRMGYAIGSLPKGIQALVKGINKKFGKGTMKTADEMDQPEKTTQQLISEFESRNKPDAITMESREILDVPEVPKGFNLSKEKLMAKFPEIEESFADDMMDMDKDMQGRIIKMLENRRLDPEAYDRLLAEYGNTLKFQAEFDKVTRRKNNNQGGLNYLMGM